MAIIFIKTKTRDIMLHATIALAMLFSSPGHSNFSSEPTSLNNQSSIGPREGQEESSVYGKRLQYQLPEGAIGVTVLPAPDFKDFDARDVAEKTRQLIFAGSAVGILTGLTLYYACTTPPSEWLSGTTGSYCTNTLLTSMAASFIYRERENLRKRQAANK